MFKLLLLKNKLSRIAQNIVSKKKEDMMVNNLSIIKVCLVLKISEMISFVMMLR